MKVNIKDSIQDLRNVTFKDIKRGFVHMIMNTHAEVVIGAAAFAALGGIWSHSMEMSKRGQIPVAYSEISDIESRAEQGGIEISPLTRYYAVTNDIAMSVFDANNISYQEGRGRNAAFADALMDVMDRPVSDRSYKTPSYYINTFNQIVYSARQSLKPYNVVKRDVQASITALDGAWDEKHSDNYRLETYTTTSCSSANGATTCRPVTNVRSVYANTTHRFTYDPEYGEASVRILNDFAQKYPDLDVSEALTTATRTGEVNRRAMHESRENLPGYKPLTDDEYLSLTQVWANGSNYTMMSQDIENSFDQLVRLAPLWQAAQPDSKSRRYTTMSRSHSGPEEFQVADAALKYAVSMSDQIGQINAGIDFAEEGVPDLRRKVRQYTDLYRYGTPKGDDAKLANNLRSEIMDDARALYAQNFSGGFDTYPVKWAMIVLWTVVGLLAGGGIGYGAHRGIEHWDKKRKHQR